jgi:hypothetical protein
MQRAGAARSASILFAAVKSVGRAQTAMRPLAFGAALPIVAIARAGHAP